MLDNPFRERAIAARANRQQLDRLLRVTAPRERIALVAVGLILVGVGAWVLFGTIDREVALDCVLLVPESDDQVASRADDAGDRHLRATLLTAPHVTRSLSRGMQASVEVQLPDGTTLRLEGSVSAADSRRQINVDLPPVPDLDLPNGAPCRARIDRGPYSLTSLLGFGSA